MARKSKRPLGLSENEKAVNLRLREARERLRLSQEDFSGELGIKRERLNSYEGMRSALPTDLGFSICENFVIGERWLAQGLGPWRQLLCIAVDYDPPEALPKLSFSNAFPYYEPHALIIINSLNRQGRFIRCNDWLNLGPTKQLVYKRMLEAHLDVWIDTLRSRQYGDDLLLEFAYRLLGFGNALTAELIDTGFVFDPYKLYDYRNRICSDDIVPATGNST